MADFPQNFVYHPSNQTLSWDEVQGATSYEIYSKLADAPEDTWVVTYIGPDIFCSFNKLQNIYNAKGRSNSGKFPYTFGPVETIIIQL